MYDKYGLIDNPFRLEHNHDIVGVSQNKTFDRVLELFKLYAAFKSRSGDRFIAAFQGEYGFGKSFFLNKLAATIKERDRRFKRIIEDDVMIAVSIFSMLTTDIRLPAQLMLHLYKSIVENLGGDGENSIRNLYEDLEDKAQAEGKRIDKLLEPLDSNFTKVILCLSDKSDKQYLAIKWLLAQRLTPTELRNLGVPYSIVTPDTAEKCIFQLLKLLKIIGYGLLVVLIDELEKVLTAIGERQFLRTFLVLQEIFDNYVDLRNAHLKPVTPIGFLVSLTPQAWETVEIGAESGKGVEAVRSRIHENVFEMERFNEEDTKDFIQMLLSKKRITKFIGSPLFPFELNTIQIIWERTYGNPRAIINDCKSLLEFGNRSGAVKINTNLVNEYYRSIGAGDNPVLEIEDNQIDLLEGEEKI